MEFTLKWWDSMIDIAKMANRAETMKKYDYFLN